MANFWNQLETTDENFLALSIPVTDSFKLEKNSKFLFPSINNIQTEIRTILDVVFIAKTKNKTNWLFAYKFDLQQPKPKISAQIKLELFISRLINSLDKHDRPCDVSVQKVDKLLLFVCSFVRSFSISIYKMDFN